MVPFELDADLAILRLAEHLRSGRYTPSPYRLTEPGGTLDTEAASYTQLDDRTVAVSGSRFIPAERYTVKLEAARVVGFQTILLALLRDPHYVANASDWAKDIEDRCTEKALKRTAANASDFSVEVRLIGQNATLGALEPRAGAPVEIQVLEDLRT